MSARRRWPQADGNALALIPMRRLTGEGGVGLPTVMDLIKRGDMCVRQADDTVLALLGELAVPSTGPVILARGSRRRYVVFSYAQFRQMREEILEWCDEAELARLARERLPVKNLLPDAQGRAVLDRVLGPGQSDGGQVR